MNDRFPPIETCDECGFDGARWTRQDATRTLEAAGALVESAISGLADEHWNVRPRPEVWSIGEYVDHLRMVLFANHFVCATAVDEEGVELGNASPPPPPDEPPELDRRETLERMAAEGTAFSRMLLDIGDVEAAAWTRTVGVGEALWSVEYSARHACHDLIHHLGDIANIRHDLGDVVGPLSGSVAQINASDGGVPKSPVRSGTIAPAGLVGDRQATRRHHGRTWQAICLYSADVLDELRAEGHPIAAGSVGENLTLSGIDWSALRSGMTVTIGDDVVLRLSVPAVPCAQNAGFFADGDFRRMDHDRHPGWSRWYASVLRPGDVAVGDPVTVRS